MSISTPVEESRKIVRLNCEDRISNLPESIISYILSCLPIKDAVRTCVLSRAWQYKWTFIYNVDIEDQGPFSGQRDENPTFADFVDRVLSLLQDVKSFHVECQAEQKLTRIASWISTAFRRNVESFEVTYLTPESLLLLPHELLSNTSLRRLSLVLRSTFSVPSQNCFPNLTSLYLCAVEICNQNSNKDTLVFRFPLLKTFELSECKWLNARFVEIHAPALTTFKSSTPDDARVDDYSIKIFGPRLATFETCGGSLENIIISGSAVVSAALHNVGEAYDLQLRGKIGLQVRRLVEGFSNIEDLVLSGWMAEAITISNQELFLPVLNKLEQLFLYSYANTEALLELLHLAPSLKYLSIDVDFLIEFNYEALGYVPSCIVYHLQEVEFEAFDGGIFPFSLAKFLMKNAVNLEKIHIKGNFGHMQKNEIVEQLSAFPRASTCLKIVAI